MLSQMVSLLDETGQSLQLSPAVFSFSCYFSLIVSAVTSTFHWGMFLLSAS